MAGREQSRAGERTVVYCIVPRDLAPKAHEVLRRHFRGEPHVQVVVERRLADRRSSVDRRAPTADGAASPRTERRRVRVADGRRVGERRVALVEVPGPPLPRRARTYADRITFVERFEPRTQDAEDDDTARLVACIQGGDPDGFALLYLRYFDRVYTYLRIVLGRRPDSEDAAQEVFLKVLEALPRYQQRGKPFRAWLFTIARNHAVTLLRRRGELAVESPERLIDDLQRADPSLEQYALAASWVSDPDLLLFIERLPQAQRQVLVLRHMLDLSHSEIGEILGRSPSDVRRLQHRALSFLRQRLASIGRAPSKRDSTGWQRRFRQARVLRNRRFALERR